MRSVVYDYISSIIKQFMDANKISYDIKEGFQTNGPAKTQVEEQSVLRQFLLYALPYKKFHGDPSGEVKISKDDFRDAFAEWKAAQWKAALESIRAAVAYTPANEEQGKIALREWLESVLWRQPEELEVIVIEHFIHQVKRKLNGKKASYHMMPVFVAGQGAGKTRAILELLAPLGRLAKEEYLSTLEDARNDLAHSKTYVMFFDELAKADKADIRMLKQRISGQEISTRLFHTQEKVEVQQNTTFIAASNERVDSLLQDTTGMRRYFQLIGPDKKRVDATPIKDRKEYWKKQTSDNQIKIWQSINENVETIPGLLENIDKISIIQEDLRMKDAVEEFLQESGWVSSFDPEATLNKLASEKSQTLYDEYKDFCERNGERFPLTANRFRLSLKKYNFVFGQQESKGRVVYARRESHAAKTASKLGIKVFNKADSDEAGS